MFLMRADTLRGQGFGPGNGEFFGPVKWHSQRICFEVNKDRQFGVFFPNRHLKGYSGCFHLLRVTYPTRWKIQETGLASAWIPRNK